MKKIIASLFLVFLSWDAQAVSMRAKISWEYKNFPGEIKIYELKSGGKYSDWQTGSVKSFQELPVSSEIQDSIVSVSSELSKKFVLVYKNDTSENIHFFAAPHHVLPPESSLGFKFNCLCINHVFSVGPGEFWYRIVSLSVDQKYKGDLVEIKHVIMRPNR